MVALVSLPSASFLANLVLGLLYESIEVCLGPFLSGAIGLLPLRMNMQCASWQF